MAEVAISYRLLPFDRQLLANTSNSWNRQLEKHEGAVFPAPYRRMLAFAEGHCKYDGVPEAFAYGLFYKEDKHADAILEVCYTRSGRKWLKLLDLTMSPEIDSGFATQSIDIHRLTHLYSAAIIGVVSLTATSHPAKTVKLYARSGTLLAFFRGVGAYIEQQGDSGLRASIEDRWLVFRSK